MREEQGTIWAGEARFPWIPPKEAGPGPSQHSLTEQRRTWLWKTESVSAQPVTHVILGRLLAPAPQLLQL